jgi:hypothetical protein
MWLSLYIYVFWLLQQGIAIIDDGQGLCRLVGEVEQHAINPSFQAFVA